MALRLDKYWHMKLPTAPQFSHIATEASFNQPGAQ